ncbi:MULTISPECIES: hypothetical protein [Burkholderia]|uniref:hypothetical protein n=1 Tax=Burkholderia TaxID=32008 RepID=UPI00163FE97E|nr:hypothetical protein [Burkholderia gladioli]
MTDPIAITSAAVTAYLSKDGVEKLLGPTAEYLGGEIKNIVERGQKNIASIFSRATKKAENKLGEPGSVNPRVLKHIIDEGRFTEDELFSEYFGGVLASARTPDGFDDRGAYYAQIVQSMSVYQLRLHYLFYYLMWQLAKGRQLGLSSYVGRYEMEIIIPVEIYSHTFSATDPGKEEPIIAHALAGLTRQELIEDRWIFSGPQQMQQSKIETTSHAFFITPTISGIELFVWAHGRGEDGMQAFLDTTLVQKDELNIQLPHLARFKTPKEAAARAHIAK